MLITSRCGQEIIHQGEKRSFSFARLSVPPIKTPFAKSQVNVGARAARSGSCGEARVDTVNSVVSACRSLVGL